VHWGVGGGRAALHGGHVAEAQHPAPLVGNDRETLEFELAALLVQGPQLARHVVAPDRPGGDIPAV
jgi:hypothetical protein